jgi:hypothetical protein
MILSHPLIGDATMTNESGIRRRISPEVVRAMECGEAEMCTTWLRFLLAPHVPPLTDIRSEVRKDLGFSPKALQRAGQALEELLIDARPRWGRPRAS